MDGGVGFENEHLLEVVERGGEVGGLESDGGGELTVGRVVRFAVQGAGDSVLGL